VDAVIWAAVALAGTERPPPLAHLPGCDLWVGTSSGNDPTNLVELRLCGDEGSIQSSSLNSGYSVRAVAGAWDGAHLVLRDVKFEVDHPADGWMFCLCESYDLTRNGDHLDGTYDSAACNDHATMALVHQDGPATPPILSRPPPPVTPAFEPPGHACGCHTPIRMSGWPLVVALVLIRRTAATRLRARETGRGSR
jgi:hypothetical protein